MPDINLLLAGGIWAFAAFDSLLPLPAGQGVLMVGETALDARVPSWRASFGGRRVVIVPPWAARRPLLPLSLVADGQVDVPALLAEVRAAHVQTRGFRIAQAATLALLLGVIPLWLLTHLAGAVFLSFALAAYACYGIAVWRLHGAMSDASAWAFLRAQRGVVLEPFLCLPYAGQVLRKLSLRRWPTVPLNALLASGVMLAPTALVQIAAVLAELHEQAPDEAERERIAALQAQVQARLPKENDDE